MKIALAQDPAAAAKLEAELENLANQTYGRFLDGITRYQNSAIARDFPDALTIWHAGTTRVLDYEGRGQPVLLIPSLINRYHVLDIDRDKSFARALAAKGFHVYLIDWQAPGTEEKTFTLNDYLEKRLKPVLSHIAALSDQRVHIAGYCMGGLLAAALAQVMPAQTKSLLFLATPWDFHADDSAMGPRMQALHTALAPLIDEWGELPPDIMQSYFFMLQPFMLHDKFVRFGKMEKSSAEERAFVLVEDWVNNGVPLAPHVAKETLQDWYVENLPAHGLWRLGGYAIRPRDSRVPSLHVLPQHDKIVPPASSSALHKAMPGADSLRPAFGHISMMVTTPARDKLWPSIFDWLASKR